MDQCAAQEELNRVHSRDTGEIFQLLLISALEPAQTGHSQTREQAEQATAKR